MFSKIALVLGLATVISAGSGPWKQADQFGRVLCETSDGSPFTTDCENAALQLATRGGHIARGRIGEKCIPARGYGSCAIMLCNGVYPQVITAGEVAFWARQINAECPKDYGNVNSPRSGGQVGVRNVNAGDVQIQLWNIGSKKRSEDDSLKAELFSNQDDLNMTEDTTLSHVHVPRAVGQSYNIANTLFELISIDESGADQCALWDDEENEIYDSIETLATNAGPLRRVIRGGTEAWRDPQVDMTVNMATGANGYYVSDISPQEWRQIVQGMMEFRERLGNRASFTVRLQSIGSANPMGYINLANWF